MKLKLVKATNKYRNQIVDMLDEWNNSGEEIIPYVIGRLDYSDFDYYCNNLEVRDTGNTQLKRKPNSKPPKIYFQDNCFRSL